MGEKMKYLKLLTVITASVGLAGTIVTTNPSSNIVEAKAKPTAKAYKHSIMYSNSKGKMTITGIEGYKMLDFEGNFSNYTVIVYGKFTNKSNHSINPLDFFSSHFKVFQVTKKQWRDMDPEGPIADAPTEDIEQLGQDGDTLLRPHKTIEIAYQADMNYKLKSGQRFTVRAYNDAYSSRRKKLATKNFYLGRVESTMNYYDQQEADEDQEWLDEDDDI